MKRRKTARTDAADFRLYKDKGCRRYHVPCL